jgi:hypothetical protein
LTCALGDDALRERHRIELIEGDEFARKRFPDGYRVELIERG